MYRKRPRLRHTRPDKHVVPEAGYQTRRLMYMGGMYHDKGMPCMPGSSKRSHNKKPVTIRFLPDVPGDMV